MLAEGLAVVRQVHDQSVLVESEVAYVIEQHADPPIDERHLSCVQSLDPVRLFVSQIACGGACHRVYDVQARVLRVSVHAPVRLRRVPRLMRIEVVDP
jgi:hypothetical protein